LFAGSAGITSLARTIIEAAISRRSKLKFAKKLSSGGKTVALKMTDRVVDGVAIVAMEGRIVLGEESTALREKVKSLLASGQKKIVLNMDNVTYIDSSGLGALVASHTSAKSQGAALKLCHLGSKFQEILQVTKLVTVFEVYPTEAAAVASFSK
jgi:anti-sigma B factor antagonist